MVKPRTRQKWKATLMLLLGLLWVLWSGFAFSSPYVARSLWEACARQQCLLGQPARADVRVAGLSGIIPSGPLLLVDGNPVIAGRVDISCPVTPQLFSGS